MGNPIATIWAGSLLLDHIGEHKAAAAVVTAIEQSIRDDEDDKDRVIYHRVREEREVTAHQPVSLFLFNKEKCKSSYYRKTRQMFLWGKKFFSGLNLPFCRNVPLYR